MDLSTTYLGLRLANPFMPGASPMVDDLDTVKKLEDAGAAAIVMHSLFEEQISGERLASIYHMEIYADSFAEAASYFPKADDFFLGPEPYVQHIQKIKQTVSIPVIASLNGTAVGGWIEYAKLIEQAGADALELNVYHVATDPQEKGSDLEKRVVEVVRAVALAVNIPLAVKLSPFYTSLFNFAYELEEAGAEGFVLFNRFYQPDIDIEELQVTPTLKLSDSSELLLRLRWLAILGRRINASLACSGGVHTAQDAVKAVMAGAHAVQMVSALLLHGPKHLSTVLGEFSQWLEQHEYNSVRQMQGNMSLSRCPDPAAFERANYMRVLQSWRQQQGA
jgi:dihydroorotate dehydrogenase (fumarate)